MAEAVWKPRLRWGTRLPGLLPPGAPPSSAQQPFALVTPGLRLALALALTAGFGLGGALAAGEALGLPWGKSWTPLVQAHGRAQLVGFVGLFVLSVALHFLPRLRGAPLAWPRLARPILRLVGLGVALQALAAAVLPLSPRGPAAVLLLLGALLQCLGATGALAVLGQTLRAGPPLDWRGGLRSVLPFLAVGFGALWLALLGNLVLCAATIRGGASAFAPGFDQADVDALLLGFALPIGMGFAARLLPIYLGTEVIADAPLRALALACGLGAVARVAADLGGGPTATILGDALLGAAGVAFPLFAGAPFGRPRALRRADPPALARAARLPNRLIRLAHGWLFFAGLLLLADAGWTLATGASPLPWDAIRHALAAGYLTSLIFGVGARLLPGFAGRRPQPIPGLGLVAAATTLAALLRVLPPLASGAGLAGPVINAAYGCSGGAGLLALAIFAWRLWPMLAASPARDRAKAAG